MTIETYKNIIEYIRQIIKGREFEGHVYSVGGCERDKHLGLQEIKDIDLVVDLPNNSGIRFARWLHSMGLVKNGNIVVYENFGTAMFRLSAFPDEEIEVVHTRKETYRDKNSRNPETAFGTIEEDCFRRDFTVNALYHNISTDEDLDLTGMGLTDLEQGIIRTCNNPDSTFIDDPLRQLRALRFCCKLGFIIEKNTVNGIIKNAHRIEIISQERITDEFNKILMSANPVLGFVMLKDYGILDVIMPEVSEMYSHIRDRFERITKSKYYTLETALAVIFNKNIIKIEQKNEILKNFKYSNDIIKEVSLYAENSCGIELASALKYDSKIRELAMMCGDQEHFNKLIAVAKAMNLTKKEDSLQHVYVVDDVDKMFGYKLPVDGNDIMDVLEIGPGKEIKIILNELMEKAYENPKITRSECMKLIIEHGSAS